MRIALLGMNRRSAPLELRERFAVSDPDPLLRKLATSEEIEEVVMLSTCNRVEVVALTRSPESARHRLRSFFARDLAGEVGLPAGADLESHLYEHRDGEAVGHVLRVASALDSMVVGEPQILGQIKEAYRAAVECRACGPILGRLFQNAFATAKRVRNETGIAERPVSVARVAVELAEQIFEEFADKRALLVGAGEMIETALGAMRERGLDSVAVANRTPERAAKLAVTCGATAHGLDELEALLEQSDVVLTSIASETPVLTHALLEKVQYARRRRPLFVIDIGVPRNVDPAIDEFDDVYLYNIDDLGSVADRNTESRRREAARAEAIVAEERQRFDGWFAALRAVPTIRHLRGQAERIRRQEVERVIARAPFDESQREALDALTRAITNKLLHAPVTRLKREAETEQGMATLEVARTLFDLDAPEGAEHEDLPEGAAHDVPPEEPEEA